MFRFVATILCAALLFVLTGCKRSPSSAPGGAAPADQFLSLMNAGKNYLDQGDATNALATYQKAAALVPNSVDLHLNLAIAHLRAGAADEANREADEALKLDPNSAAAYFIKGSAYVRLNNFEEAVKALENANKIDPGEPASYYQLGIARNALRQFEEAITSFREGISMEQEKVRVGPRYLLAQALIRAGRQDEADQELELHQASLAGGTAMINANTFEKSKFTAPRVPFSLEQPEKAGIKVKFVDATKQFLGDAGDQFSGPLAVIDVNRTGWNSLFAMEKAGGIRLLWNSNGVFSAFGDSLPAMTNSRFHKMLVGDLQQDRFEDIMILGENGSQLFKFATNGQATDVSRFSRLNVLNATDGMLIDLDFTGKLDLLVVGAQTNDVRLFRQLGPLYFADISATSGPPATLIDAQSLTMADWNRDQIMDVIASRKSGPPMLLERQRGGTFIARQPTNWVAGSVFTTGDFDNDLLPDLAIVTTSNITICFNAGERAQIAVQDGSAIKKLINVDYDNDGWLDLWAVGDKPRAWRNGGLAGFQEQTTELGLTPVGAVSEIHFADFDGDCDSDAVVALAGGGLRVLRNEGGNANSQVKVQLVGNRSNYSGLGCKVEIVSGSLRLIRTVHTLPVEIGVGKHTSLDSFLVHWFNWPQGSAELKFTCKEPLFALEMILQEGSCPYVYVWDGKTYRFITDILGASPLGLPVAPGRYIESDPEELVWIGNEKTFPTKDGNYELQITEELREVLYLDEAKLVVVDHEPGTEVHSTDKLLPGKPFPTGSIITLHNEHPLQRAETLEGSEVTALLKSVDNRRASPPNLRAPQLRGLAESHGYILDFGPLDATKPLALVLNGWLRFGGGMANIAASHDPSLPFPFPILEAETAAGTWKPVNVMVGAPAGKTKSIVVDLEGKLEPNTRRLRLTQAFEIHWDRIALMEKKPNAASQVTYISPSEANLHFRGFSPIQDLPSDFPLTPDYDIVRTNYYWTIIPGGWCTRYGDVTELIIKRDEALALINSGDELTLKFPTVTLPPKPAGSTRQFFLYTDGWDKDSDFHVAAGDRIDPLPYHGMDDQTYGQQPRPKFASDSLHQKYNTRWVDSKALKQTARR